MKNKFTNLLIAALLVFGALTAASPVSAHSDGAELTGVISAIDTSVSTLSVTPKTGGTDVVFKVDSSTVITRLYHTATLADLQVGDRVEVKYDPSTMLASRIEAQLNLVNLVGLVYAVDTGAGTLTVLPHKGGANVVLKVDSTTLIKRNGKPVTLADIQLGNRIQARYNPVTLLAARISVQLYLIGLNGTISAVDPIASTVTVTPKKGGADIVLKVDTTTVIKRNYAPATLADFQVGDLVDARYNAVTLVAAWIKARPNLVEVKGTISGVGAGTVTVTPKKGGADIVLNVDTTTVIKRNDAPATLADLQVGDLVDAKYNAVTLLAAWIKARPNLVEMKGTISGVGAGTVTVTPKKGGADIVLKVDTTTVIKRNDAPVTLADLQVGDLVDAKYNAVTLLAAWIKARPNLVEVEGTISGVGAETVTVTPKKSGADIVLKVDTTTVIKRNDAPATLADLQVGDLVDAKYNAVTLLAVKIEAEMNLAELDGTISGVGAGTVTVTPKKGGADIVLKVDANTHIRRNDHTATLADLQVGDRVEAEYDPATLLAIKIDAMDKSAD